MAGYEHGKSRTALLAQEARALETRIRTLRTDLAKLTEQHTHVRHIITQQAEAEAQLRHHQREARRLAKENEAAASELQDTLERLAAITKAEQAALTRKTERETLNGFRDEAYAAYDWSMRHFPDNQFMGIRRRRALEAELKAHETHQEAA